MQSLHTFKRTQSLSLNNFISRKNKNSKVKEFKSEKANISDDDD